MSARGIVSVVLVAFVVVVHTGCGEPLCPPNSVGPYDNRERTQFPNTDQDWICVALPEPVAPPEPPDLGGFKPADPPGPRDRDAVMKAAIFIGSCAPIFWDFNAPSINAHIDAAYRTVLFSPEHRAIFERVNCFKDKTNGCDAVRECLGIVNEFEDTVIAASCTDGISMEHNTAGNSWTHWTNCVGLGLECHDEPWVFCGPPRVSCDLDVYVPTCLNGESPRDCSSHYAGGPEYVYDVGSCADYGVTCMADGSGASCTGLGPACKETFEHDTNYFLIDFRAGIACENETTLRACVNGHEQLVDCTTQGEGFRCFGGTHPRCGYDFQCDPVDWEISYDLQFPHATCEGSSINVCNSGVRTTIDCKTLGFETCNPERGVCTSKPSAK